MSFGGAIRMDRHCSGQLSPQNSPSRNFGLLDANLAAAPSPPHCPCPATGNESGSNKCLSWVGACFLHIAVSFRIGRAGSGSGHSLVAWGLGESVRVYGNGTRA